MITQKFPLHVDNSEAVQPTHHQWEMLKRLDDRVMSLDEFLQHWKLTRTQIAFLLGSDKNTVLHWLTGICKPPQRHLRRLAVVHRLWSKI